MKRFRIINNDYDTRARLLTIEIKDEWKEEVKKLHRSNKEQVLQSLVEEFGADNAERKIKNFVDLGSKPFSIVAFHNKFFEQIRRSFVIGSYYPALTASCSLGERILNHLIIRLRNHFSSTPEFKRVYRKESFDKWELAIATLDSWKVLLPKASEKFRALAALRNRVIHFNPDTDNNDRELALQAVSLLTEIISEQFSSFGPQPWFITGIPGEIYIKKEAEVWPFVLEIYLPNCQLVGPNHTIEVKTDGPTISFIVNNEGTYPPTEISDEEFCALRKAATSN